MAVSNQKLGTRGLIGLNTYLNHLKVLITLEIPFQSGESIFCYLLRDN